MTPEQIELHYQYSQAQQRAQRQLSEAQLQSDLARDMAERQAGLASDTESSVPWQRGKWGAREDPPLAGWFERQF